MQTKIDCSIAENYIKEEIRICGFYIGTVWCSGCPFAFTYKEMTRCKEWKVKHPKESVEIVQAWSDEHPIEPVVTRQDKFLEQYPNAPLDKDVLKIMPCMADKLAFNTNACMSVKDCEYCRIDYWGQPYKENDK